MSRGIYLYPPVSGLCCVCLELSELLQANFLRKEVQTKVGVARVVGDHMIIGGEINQTRGTADFLGHLSTHCLLWGLPRIHHTSSKAKGPIKTNLHLKSFNIAFLDDLEN